MENNSNKYKTHKIAGILGISSFFTFLTFTLISVDLIPWFSWTKNWLSELAGTHGSNPFWSAYGLPSIIFNIGLIISGIFALAFVIILVKNRIIVKGYQKIIMILIGLSTMALILCGIFPVTFGLIHTFFALVYLGLIPIIFVFVGLELRRLYGKKWFWVNNSFCTVFFVSFGLFFLTPNLTLFSKAIAEMILILGLYTIIIAICVNLLFFKSKKKQIFNLKKLSSMSPHALYNKKIFRDTTSKR